MSVTAIQSAACQVWIGLVCTPPNMTVLWCVAETTHTPFLCLSIYKKKKQNVSWVYTSVKMDIKHTNSHSTINLKPDFTDKIHLS